MCKEWRETFDVKFRSRKESKEEKNEKGRPEENLRSWTNKK